MALQVRFYNLDTGKFRRVKEATFRTDAEALAAVKAYAEPAGYTNVKVVDDGEDPGSYRITARTPGGRGGRNIAMVDVTCEEFIPEVEVSEDELLGGSDR